MADLLKIADELSSLSVLEAADLLKMLEERLAGAGHQVVVLFEDRQRTRVEPLRRGEGLFQFYDDCARDGYDEFRLIINTWLAEMPRMEREELITRMQNGGDREFGSSLCEISVHAFIVRSGCKALVHPQVPGSSRHPDFAATDQDGNVLTYVEVTTVNSSDVQKADVNRENPVYNAIDAAELPEGSCLGYRLVRAGKNSPALRPLVTKIEQWARENVEIAKKDEVIRRFTAGDWVIELDLYAGGMSTNSAEQRAIGIAETRRGNITLHQDLRKALDKKSERYGTLNAPYLIVVADATGQLFGKRSIGLAVTQAVFGDEIVQFRDGKAHVTYAPNGFWHGEKGTQNLHVSGVLLLPETGLWRLREQNFQPVLAVNPWAEHRLPAELTTLNRFEAENELWVSHDGQCFGDILGLPTPWPPDETD